jgi:hypothetical protein
MHNCLINDDQQRHFVSIRPICAIHNQNFIIILQKLLRADLYKEQISDVIIEVLLKIEHSVFFIQILDQCLNDNQ